MDDLPEHAAEAEARGDRIAKFLARAGVASRRDVEALIAAGKVRLNDVVVTHPATFVRAGDRLMVDGKPVGAPERTRLFRYHKPDGLVTTHKDPEGRRTVFDALPEGMPRVVSVGRLDLTSEGLLLLTNDGALARRLELPSTGWLRRYRARVWGRPDRAALARLAEGVTIDGVAYGPVEAAVDSARGETAWLSIGLREGKNREVRKLCQHMDLIVTRLIRTAYGPFQLGAMPKGSVEEVTTKQMREQVPRETSTPRVRAAARTGVSATQARLAAKRARAVE